ncbi:MAG: hypothetical protein AB7V39_03610, partial [Nitrospiraceae bacterium]
MAQPPYKTPEPVPHGGGIPPDPPFTSGVPGFDDTFFGPNDKRYIDRKAKAMSNLRGIDMYYYKMKNQTQDIDGPRPLTDGPGPAPELEVRDQKTQPIPVRARSGNMSLYGESVIVQNRLDSVRREVIPDWDYADPVAMRALGMEPQQEEEPDDRGTIFIYSLKLHVARILLDEAKIRPRAGDVIRLPKLLESYYDVKHVERDQ